MSKKLLEKLGYDKWQWVKAFEEILREEGLTEKQIEAGVKYYINFCLKFDIPPKKGARMFIECIRNMERGLTNGRSEQRHTREVV